MIVAQFTMIIDHQTIRAKPSFIDRNNITFYYYPFCTLL